MKPNVRFVPALKILFRIVAASFLLATALSAAGQQDPAANVKDIPSFVACMNNNVKEGANANISNAVMCVPKGCMVYVTMSQASAQASCNLGSCQLPRVIFDCPGPAADLRFRPSFLLCPIDSNQDGEHPFGTDRIEIGEDITPVEGDTGNMKMADMAIAPNKPYMPQTAASVTSTVGNNKNCNACHISKTPADAKNGDPIISEAIHPFSKSCAAQGVDVSEYVIDTNDPSEIAKPGDVKVGGVQVQAQKLADVCKCIMNNQNAIKNDANNLTKIEENFPSFDTEAKQKAAANPNLDPATLLALCNNLSSYNDNRACGKAMDSDGKVLPCAEVDGGGKFLDNPPVDDAVSTVVFELSGQAEVSSSTSSSTTYTWVNTGGSISGFAFKTFNSIASVQVTTLTATSFTSGDLQISGTGTAMVNGSAQSVLFNFNFIGGVTSYTIESMSTLTPLAFGVGESGRAGIALSVNP